MDGRLLQYAKTLESVAPHEYGARRSLLLRGRWNCEKFH